MVDYLTDLISNKTKELVPVLAKDLPLEQLHHLMAHVNIPDKLYYQDILIFAGKEDKFEGLGNREQIKQLYLNGTKYLDAMIYAYSPDSKRNDFTFKVPQPTEDEFDFIEGYMPSVFFTYLFTGNFSVETLKVIPGFSKRFLKLDNIEIVRKVCDQLTVANVNYALDLVLHKFDFKQIKSKILRNRILLGIAGHRLPRAAKLFAKVEEMTEDSEREFMTMFVNRIDVFSIYLGLHNSFKSSAIQDNISINRLCEHVLFKSCGKSLVKQLQDKKVIFNEPREMEIVKFNMMWMKLKKYVDEIILSKLEME